MNQIIDIFSRFTNELNNLIELPEQLEKIITIKFYDSQEELLDGVLKYTIPELKEARKNSKDFINKCLGGTINRYCGMYYIHIYIGNKNVEQIGYVYIHELVHVCNQVKYYENITEYGDIYELNNNPILHLWDEFMARYYSSVVFLRYYIEKGVDKKEYYTDLLTSFQNTVQDDEYESYDGTQYLGFVAAMADCNLIIDADMGIYLNINNSKIVYEKLRCIKEIESII